MSQNDDQNRDRNNQGETFDEANRGDSLRESRPGSPSDDRGNQSDSTRQPDESSDLENDEMDDDDRDDDQRTDGGSNRRRSIS
jgi:hypothetical protein